jgi:hypothetical protein
MIDERLKQWASPVQVRNIDAVIRHGGVAAAARALDVRETTIRKSLRAVRRKAAAQGFSPEHGLNSVIPEPFVARGHSTLEKLNPDGSRTQVLQWTKTRLDDEQYREMLAAAVDSFVNDNVAPLAPLSKGPRVYCDDIIPWINIGDAHFGMLAHASESGEDFNLEIAETEMKAAIGLVIDEMRPTERIVIQDMGDFTHYENTSKVTEKSRNPLEVDRTMPDMIRVYSRTMRWIVEKALTKARHVDVIINQANHSRSNDWWMAELLRVAYGHTGRVHVLNNDQPFIAYRMGETLVMCHHSDLVKPNQLANIMTTDFREDYGQTRFHYVDIGHIHHGMVMKEHPSVKIESFNQLARADNYAYQHGYRSRNSLTVIFRSTKYGEIGRRVLSIEELQERVFGGIKPVERSVFRAA